MLVKDAGSIGIIKDKPGYALPSGAWSDGLNVRMREGAVHKVTGHRTAIGTPSAVPYFVLPVRSTGTNAYWIYAGATDVYITDGTTHKEITRTSGDYTASTTAQGWSGLVFGGIPILNSGTDTPQQWATIDFATPTKLTDLSNWPANTTCKFLGGFKSFLIALDVTASGTNYPRMVKWSHASTHNSVPSSWSISDNTKDAGEYSLEATQGKLLGGRQLKDAYMLYKADSVFGMQYVGAPFVFRFFQISEEFGALSKHSMCEFEGGHFVFGTNDCVVNDGVSIKSVMTQRMRSHVYGLIDATNFENSFVVPNFIKNEIWCCFPRAGQTWPDYCVIWNYKENTFSTRELPTTAYIGSGIVNPGDAVDWNSDTEPWDSDMEFWDERLFNPAQTRLITAGTGNTKLYLMDATAQFDGTDFTSYVERTGLHFDTPRTVKLCTEVALNMDAYGPGTVEVMVGYHNAPEEGVTWSTPVSFDPKTDYKIDCMVSGKYLALRVQSSTELFWTLNSYQMNITDLGAG
jgi:hypothetical protein